MSDLTRFLEAQASVYPQVLTELKAARKRSHWMWFIFPQLAGLGRSATAAYYGITDLRHARQYCGHPVLGARLRECVQILNGLVGATAQEIFGFPDCLKLHSSLTLFREAAPEDPIFDKALATYCSGRPDPQTLGLLNGQCTGS